MLITFTFTGHIALSSVAWVPEFIDRLGVSFATWGTIIGFAVLLVGASAVFAELSDAEVSMMGAEGTAFSCTVSCNISNVSAISS